MTRGDDVAPAVIESFVAGDERALSTIYQRWSPLVYSVALSSLGNVTDAEDVTLQVFAEAWATRATFGQPHTRLPVRLIEITRHVLSEARTARPQQVRARTPGTTTTRECDDIEAPDLADRLVVADEMTHLSEVSQQAIRLALSEGLTHTQIAERMQLPADLVRRHLSGSLLELRERLAVLHDAH
jgi:RNA polymerase sigma-70 factor, ECF subfamily